MPDERHIITLTRTGPVWLAYIEEPGYVDKVAEGSGPGEVLEVIGQDLDRREAERLTAHVQAAGGVPLDDEERELYGNVAAVVEVLEGHPDERGLSILEVLDLVDLEERAAIVALEQAERDGVVIRRMRDPFPTWRLASDDEVETGADG